MYLFERQGYRDKRKHRKEKCSICSNVNKAWAGPDQGQGGLKCFSWVSHERPMYWDYPHCFPRNIAMRWMESGAARSQNGICIGYQCWRWQRHNHYTTGQSCHISVLWMLTCWDPRQHVFRISKQTCLIPWAKRIYGDSNRHGHAIKKTILSGKAKCFASICSVFEIHSLGMLPRYFVSNAWLPRASMHLLVIGMEIIFHELLSFELMGMKKGLSGLSSAAFPEY